MAPRCAAADDDAAEWPYHADPDSCPRSEHTAAPGQQRRYTRVARAVYAPRRSEVQHVLVNDGGGGKHHRPEESALRTRRTLPGAALCHKVHYAVPSELQPEACAGTQHRTRERATPVHDRVSRTLRHRGSLLTPLRSSLGDPTPLELTCVLGGPGERNSGNSYTSENMGLLWRPASGVIMTTPRQHHHGGVAGPCASNHGWHKPIPPHGGFHFQKSNRVAVYI